MSKDLQLLYKIQSILKANGYFDVSRISQEILKYCRTNFIELSLVLSRIEQKEPWEYIKGEAEFYGNRFLINRTTLIPRVETQQIVDITRDFLHSNSSYQQIFDVGTGSGCIIISLAKILCKKKNIMFFAIDRKKKTLEIAKGNSVLHKVNKKVAFLRGNLLKGIKIKKDSLIIANLPYIPSKMYKELDSSVVDFEPKFALSGGRDGLKYYRRLIKQISKKRNKDVKISLIAEIEPSTVNNFRRLIESKHSIVVFKDYREVERFVLVQFS